MKDLAQRVEDLEKDLAALHKLHARDIGVVRAGIQKLADHLQAVKNMMVTKPRVH